MHIKTTANISRLVTSNSNLTFSSLLLLFVAGHQPQKRQHHRLLGQPPTDRPAVPSHPGGPASRTGRAAQRHDAHRPVDSGPEAVIGDTERRGQLPVYRRRRRQNDSVSRATVQSAL